MLWVLGCWGCWNYWDKIRGVLLNLLLLVLVTVLGYWLSGVLTQLLRCQEYWERILGCSCWGSGCREYWDCQDTGCRCQFTTSIVFSYPAVYCLILLLLVLVLVSVVSCFQCSSMSQYELWSMDHFVVGFSSRCWHTRWEVARLVQLELRCLMVGDQFYF